MLLGRCLCKTPSEVGWRLGPVVTVRWVAPSAQYCLLPVGAKPVPCSSKGLELGVRCCKLVCYTAPGGQENTLRKLDSAGPTANLARFGAVDNRSFWLGPVILAVPAEASGGTTGRRTEAIRAAFLGAHGTFRWPMLPRARHDCERSTVPAFPPQLIHDGSAQET